MSMTQDSNVLSRFIRTIPWLLTLLVAKCISRDWENGGKRSSTADLPTLQTSHCRRIDNSPRSRTCRMEPSEFRGGRGREEAQTL
ncbi:hypothetical protein AALO_G00283010 [Alosa alosa]|uniref:Secreted protein n=1 Tax=Alosa alosa TaxID=278164 RepID=A0AAV6FKY8_9TELE|nr:hypothetical protein AALO_G00283010 [Alosa alosa]